MNLSDGNPTKAKPFLTGGLLLLLLTGMILIVVVFAANPAALPLNLGAAGNPAVAANSATLPIISMQKPAANPAGVAAFGYDPATGPKTETVGTVQIPDPERPVTVFLAGAAGCSSCGIEAQYLANIREDYDEAALQIVFVDIYNYGGSDHLAWFANLLDATNLTWAIDTDGSFKRQYGVDLDSTVILNRNGEILYRDHVVTPEEALRDEIELALAKTS